MRSTLEQLTSPHPGASVTLHLRFAGAALMSASPSKTVAPILPAVPRPRSPPKYPENSGTRRLQLDSQILNREILFLEEELQSLEDAQPVSICCKEFDEFVRTNADPFIPQKRERKSCSFLRSLRSRLCCSLSWLCFSTPRSPRLKKTRKCACDRSNNCRSFRQGFSCFKCPTKCRTLPRCNTPRLACPKCSCGCVWYCCPNCTGHESCCFARPCCSSQCLCS